jgi:integrase
MTHVSKRGQTYHFDHVLGGHRLRCSLGTHNPQAAARLATRVEFALADGPRSPVWAELKGSLPASSFDVLTSRVGVTIQPDLAEFETRFIAHLDRRVRLGELADRSRKLYETAARRFFLAMSRECVQKMDKITSGIVDDYCVERTEDIQANGGSGRGVILETTVLALIFDYAVQEGVIPVSPLKRRPRPAAPKEEVLPFSPEEVQKMDEVAKDWDDALLYGVFKHTGLRCSDVANLLWSAVDWPNRTLRWRTGKRGTKVDIPINREFFRLLEDSLVPGEKGRMFPDANTTRLYKHIRRIGEKAGIENVHPHRFRHTLACTMLAKGASLYDVAKILGDSHTTVEKNYAKWTPGQADRVRELLENNSSNSELLVA